MVSKRDSPFLYPKSRHNRRLKPQKYIRYQPYKRHVRREFEQKCIYCRRPDSVHPNDHKTYAVEHYWPKEHFPEKECDYANLFYACAMCNSFKGEYWPVDDSEPFFPNPCDHAMMDHVRFVDCAVAPQSVCGSFMAETLQLNEDEVVAWRRSHTWTIRARETEVAHLQRLKKRLRKKASQGRGATNIDEDLAAIDAKIAEHVGALDRACGTTL